MQIKSMGCGLAACALLFWSIGPAAAEGPYLSLRGGVTFLQDTDMTINISGVGALDKIRARL
jgi:hypothetical protein